MVNDTQLGSTPQQPEKGPHEFWALVAQASMLGWNLIVPIVGGVLLGRYLDDKLGNEFTWTLSLLLGGVAVAFNNLYAMYVENSDAEPLRKRIRKQRQTKAEKDEPDAKNE
jgi:predicted F0F1-ATPase subunit